jgi:hypothetical protein
MSFIYNTIFLVPVRTKSVQVSSAEPAFDKTDRNGVAGM